MIKIRPNIKNSLICIVIIAFIYLCYLLYNADNTLSELQVELADVHR